jgi:hypothetical protein
VRPTCARGCATIVQTIGGTKRKVFVSFDYERDRPYKDFFINQSRKPDATWFSSDSSDPYPTDLEWVANTTRRIKQAEAMVVLLGPTTFKSPGVLKEVTIAQILKKFVSQIIPYGAGMPHVIPNVGRVIRWDWDNVKRAIATAPARWGSQSTPSRSSRGF